MKKNVATKTMVWQTAIISAVMAFFIIVNISGCSFDKSFPDLSNAGNVVCFETEVLPVIQSNCAKAGCHDAVSHAEGYDFSNYDGIVKAVKPGKPNSSKLYKVLSGSGEGLMPPPPNTPLTAEQQATIKLWIEQGALDLTCTTVTCDTTNVTYSGSVVPILQNYCLGCHANQSTGGGILLNTYDEVVYQALYGNLLGAVSGEPGMVPMPLNGSPLDECKITTIEIWVNNGTPNN